MVGRSRDSTSPNRAINANAQATAAIAAQLAQRWPVAPVELDYHSPFELLVATILAAQSTDKMINTITPAVFAKYPDPQRLAMAEPAALEALIFKSGFYRTKAKHLIAMAQALVARHDGEVPASLDELCALPGVARKTANVVLGNALGRNDGMAVDTHVTRLSARLGLTDKTQPVEIEQDLIKLVPRDQWTIFSNRLIHHGRYLCKARTPLCAQCPLVPLCPSANALASPARGSKRAATGKKPASLRPQKRSARPTRSAT